MLQLTVKRIADCDSFSVGRPILVANAGHKELVDEQLSAAGIGDYTALLEPSGRNTAPAIALAALEAEADSVLLVMPSDHTIADLSRFHEAITRALPLVDQGWLVAFGIKPDGPETGYGYIKMGEPCSAGVNQVTRFIEKPTAAHAAAMLAEGDHAWNAGIFMFRADAYLAALGRHRPEILAAVKAALDTARRTGKHITPDPGAFAACPSESVDYAIMEHEERVACVPVDMGWSDVGNWDSLHDVSVKDPKGNSVRGRAMVLGASNCLIHTDGPRVTVVDVDDLIVVVSQGEVMILRRGDSQKVRVVTEALKSQALAASAAHGDD